MNRLLILDSARAIAALAVVIYHFSYRYTELYYPEFLPSIAFLYNFKYGVEFFFIISGFVIFWSVELGKSKLDFVKSRFIRLYPIYALMLTFSFIMVSAFGLEGREVELHEFALNFLMFHDYLGIKHVDGVYWSLAVELNFYFSFLFFLYFKKIEGIKYFLLILSCVGLIDELEILSLPSELLLISISKYAIYFLFGVISYELKFKEKSLSLCCLLFIVLIALSLLACSKGSIMPLFVILLFGWLLKFEPKILITPLLLTLGSSSYVFNSSKHRIYYY